MILKLPAIKNVGVNGPLGADGLRLPSVSGKNLPLPNVFGASTAARTAREATSARRFARTETVIIFPKTDMRFQKRK